MQAEEYKFESLAEPSGEESLSELEVRMMHVMSYLNTLDENKKVDALNRAREILHNASPFKGEPVDFVRWVRADEVYANDYNPNTVAPPEMALLAHSIMTDGYTQPIVSWPTEDGFEVVDGFHRNRVGKEHSAVTARVKGYLPVVGIKSEQSGKNDRIAATIRHNRARGKHQVDSMSEIVVELKRRNWSDARISKELGMDEDEILRLCQITGLAELFEDQEFSKAWEVEGAIDETDFQELTDDPVEDETFRSVHTGGDGRVFHTFDQWECYKAGFYSTGIEGIKADEGKAQYRDFLADLDAFEEGLKGVITEWNNSCEHYLTNESMNRIAWLGQAAACYSRGLPSVYRGGFNLLTSAQQESADALAHQYLNLWLRGSGREEVDIDEARTVRQMDIY